mmetsp:Transcript_88753/g.255952  ORF Transcript_88753/g.255952 Transcript_88753/m.255952 type:complete len:252 (-) Transcript_88753:464-1219(-)
MRLHQGVDAWLALGIIVPQEVVLARLVGSGGDPVHDVVRWVRLRRRRHAHVRAMVTHAPHRPVIHATARPRGQQDEAVEQPGHLYPGLMYNHHDRDAIPVRDQAHVLHNGLCIGGRQARCRLVAEHDLRQASKAASQRDSLPLPAGDPARALVANVLVLHKEKAEVLQRLLRTPLDHFVGVLRWPLLLQCLVEHHRLLHSQVRRQHVFLRHIGRHALEELVPWPAVKMDGAPVRLRLLAGEDVDQCRLAAS